MIDGKQKGWERQWYFSFNYSVLSFLIKEKSGENVKILTFVKFKWRYMVCLWFYFFLCVWNISKQKIKIYIKIGERRKWTGRRWLSFVSSWGWLEKSQKNFTPVENESSFQSDWEEVTKRSGCPTQIMSELYHQATVGKYTHRLPLPDLGSSFCN